MLKSLSEYSFKTRPKCHICGREIFLKDKKAKVKDLDKDISVVYCHICVKDEETNEEYQNQLKAKQAKKTKINFLRVLALIIAIVTWELSQKFNAWVQVIWIAGGVIIFLLFAIINDMLGVE